MTDEHVRVAGHRVTDLSTVLGGAIWVVVLVSGTVGLVETLLAFSLLVLVPLGLGIAATPDADGGATRPYRVAVLGQPAAAVLATVALGIQPGAIAVVLVLPWVGVTAAIALFGLWRLRLRGVRPIQELAVDAAMLYVVVGAVGLALHQAGISLRFRPIIILLTAVHYHYAGFVLPLVAGMVGRVVAGGDQLGDDPRGESRLGDGLLGRTTRATTGVIVVNLALIAVGITFSPLVEVVAVALFTVAVAVFALAVLGSVVPTRRRVPGALLTVASLSVVGTMALALGYGYSSFTGETVVTLDEMIRYHGRLNAFGFALPALLAFRLQTPAGVDVDRPAFSRLRAGWRVGMDYFDRNGLRSGDATGMVDDFGAFAREDFDPATVAPGVRRFYEDSAEATMDIRPSWNRWIRPAAPLYAAVTRRVEQLNLPVEPWEGGAGLTSETLAVDDDADSRTGVRAWCRAYPDGTAMYVAAYAVQHVADGAYLGAAFPLPGGNLTGVLRPERLPASDGPDGLRLTTHDGTGNPGGLYLVRSGRGARLPLDETLRVWKPGAGVDVDSPFSVASDEVVLARHDVTLLGQRLVTLHYRIET